MTSRLIQSSLLLLFALTGGLCLEDNEYEWSELAGRWMKYHSEPATWEDARLRCHGEGAILASPLNFEMKEAIETLVHEQKIFGNINQEPTIFLGVHATFSSGYYSSIEGVPLPRLAITWAQEEPDNKYNSERCLSMSVVAGTVADTRCDKMLPYVCYKNHEKRPDPGKVYRYDYKWSQQVGGWFKYHMVPATREDARRYCQVEGATVAFPSDPIMWKEIETIVQQQRRNINEKGVTVFAGIDEAIKESDNSEKCLAMTIHYNTGTMTTYTRCNRLLSYVCYRKYFEFEINECGTTDTGYVFEPNTGSCYKFHSKGLSWPEAYTTCAADGGYLAVINNQEEADVIGQIISKHPEVEIDAEYTYFTNVGIHDWGHFSTNFMTIHGESLKDTYQTWHAGEPNNATESIPIGEFCGSVFRDMGLNDSKCNMKLAFICEKDPKII